MVQQYELGSSRQTLPHRRDAWAMAMILAARQSRHDSMTRGSQRAPSRLRPWPHEETDFLVRGHLNIKDKHGKMLSLILAWSWRYLKHGNAAQTRRVCVPRPMELSDTARRRPATAGVEGAALTINGRNAAALAAETAVEAVAAAATCARPGEEANAGAGDDTMSTPVDESWRRRCALPSAARESASDDEAGAAGVAFEKFALNSMSITAGGRLAPAISERRKKERRKINRTPASCHKT
jgi:hypothetical protein